MPAVATHLGSELRPSGPCLCLKESMEERDEKPPGPLKTGAQDSLLPPESIVKVEKEDAGSLALPSPTWQLHLEEENQYQSRTFLMTNHSTE
ncbi:zinc finger protein 180 isoform X6 [Prionailurus viverrinus]|uniref:zinc finger protein 180 isoform X6 n=1 Tax=Prionailurus viverrinus TaxID=61388 RepID=UPI001FF17619|nr:zinc finger protein 180 isoform X6 [Prionailurus viverrinus]